MLRFAVASWVALGAIHAAQGNAVPCQNAESPPNAPSAQPFAPLTPQSDSSDNNKGEPDRTEGDMTYYHLGMGACGEDDSIIDDTGTVVALSHLLMGEQSNDNPFCDRTITVRFGDKVATAVVRDKCMGCAVEDIDVSKAVFIKLVGSLDAGRVRVEWQFN